MKNNSRVQTRQATENDMPMIAAFYSEAFSEVASLKYPSRWNWLYQDNPFCDKSKGLPVWISVQGDQVVGMAGTMQCPFQIDETVFNAAWGCDLRVSSSQRGKGLGKSLEKARMASDFFSLQMSKLSRVVKTKAGGVPGKTTTAYLHVKRFEPSLLFEDLLRYMKIKSPKSSILYRVGINLHAHKLVSFFIAFLFNFSRMTKSIPPGQSRMSHLEFKATDEFDEAATRLWDNVSKKYTLAARRDSAYLNWKFVNQPHINYQRFLVHNNGELCGILIFRLGKEPEIPVGTIAEAYTDQGDAVLEDMIAFALKSLYGQGALMVRCASTTKDFGDILVKLGFRAFQYYVPVFLLNDQKQLQQRALEGPWLLSCGDQDLDEYPHSGQPSLKELSQIIFGKLIGQEDLPPRNHV